MLKHRTHSWAIIAVLGLAVTLGCSSDPATPLSLEDLIGDLDMFLTSTTEHEAGAGSSGFATEPGAATIGPFVRPALSQVRIPFPGTKAVLSWPVDRMLPISSVRTGDAIIHRWPFVDWRDFSVIDPSDRHIGNSGIIYWKNGAWHAETTEWLRVPNERTGTTWDPHEKLTVGQPSNAHPVAFFIAGPWRHSKNETRFQRRTEPDWHLWGDLKPWVWDDEEDPEDPAEPEEPEEETTPSEIHVYITLARTELAGGTQVDFPGEIGDVELLSLFGRQLQVVDGEVPTGTYSYVTFTIDPARSYVMFRGKRQPLAVPDNQIRVEGPFVVAPGGPTSVVLDLDPVSKLTENSDGSWTLALVIVVDTGTG